MTTYQRLAPVLGRILIAVPFIVGALFKIPGTQSFSGEVGMTAAVGVPLATVAVFLAFVLEAIAGLGLIFNVKTRLIALVLVPYVILLTALFHFKFTSPTDIGFFIDHLTLVGALLYVSVYRSA